MNYLKLLQIVYRSIYKILPPVRLVPLYWILKEWRSIPDRIFGTFSPFHPQRLWGAFNCLYHRYRGVFFVGKVHISSSWLHTSNWGGEKEHVAR
jgi:hypothetical protein